MTATVASNTCKGHKLALGNGHGNSNQVTVTVITVTVIIQSDSTETATVMIPQNIIVATAITVTDRAEGTVAASRSAHSV